MKLTELVTALEDYKQLVQNVIDPLVTLIAVNASLGSPDTGLATALPPPSSRTTFAATVRENRTVEARAGKKEGPDKSKRQTKSVGHGCEKHPESEIGTRGRCAQCARDYAREWARKKKGIIYFIPVDNLRELSTIAT